MSLDLLPSFCFVTGGKFFSSLPPGFPTNGWLCAICRSLQLSQSTDLLDDWFYNFNQVYPSGWGGQ